MRTVSIKLTDEEYEALNSYSVSANEKLKHIVRSHVSIRRITKDSTVEDFIFDKIKITNEHADRLTLTECYLAYTDWCLANSFNPLSKQQFRSGMQDQYLVFETAGGGRKIFRFIRMQEDNINGIEETWGD